MTNHLLTEDVQQHYHYVMGRRAGPVLRVQPADIIAIDTVDAFGGLTGTDRTVTLQERLPQFVRRTEVTTEEIVWSEGLALPYEPSMGTVARSPETETTGTLKPNRHGGNMDLPDGGPGSTPTAGAGQRGAPLPRRRSAVGGTARYGA